MPLYHTRRPDYSLRVLGLSLSYLSNSAARSVPVGSFGFLDLGVDSIFFKPPVNFFRAIFVILLGVPCPAAAATITFPELALGVPGQEESPARTAISAFSSGAAFRRLFPGPEGVEKTGGGLGQLMVRFAGATAAVVTLAEASEAMAVTVGAAEAVAARAGLLLKLPGMRSLETPLANIF